MAEVFANNASSPINGAISVGATSLVVGSAASFPTTGNFRLLVDSEYMLVTAVAGNTFTVSRGIEGSVAAAHLNGALATSILTAGALLAIAAAPVTLPVPGGVIAANQSLAATDTWKFFQAGNYTITIALATPGQTYELGHAGGNLENLPVTLSRGSAGYTIEDPQTSPPRTTANTVLLSTSGLTYRFRLDTTSNILRFVQ